MNCRGFTLIEMMVVLLILSVTIALVAPKVGSGWKRLEDGDFLQVFTETIKRARLFAISSGRPVIFRINGAERVYDLVSPPQKPIPQNVEIFSEHLEKDPESGDFFITFYPDGSLVGSDFDVVFDHVRTFRIYINPLFGTVRVSRIEAK
jgi:general secretion pathway protein H